MGLNQLLVRTGGKNVLIDTGLGMKRTPREMQLLDAQMPRQLPSELTAFGVEAADIDIVILTHLHYDHCGGATLRREGELAPTFTNSVYYLQRREYEYASRLTKPSQRSYYPDDYEPLVQAGRLQMVDGDVELLPGLKLCLTGGHTPGHQVAVMKSEAWTLFYPGDLFATRRHWRTKVNPRRNYDPAVVEQQRQVWYERARAGNWSCFFCHEPRDPIGVLGD